MSTINPRISSFFAAIFFRFPRKCSPGGLSKPLRDVRRRPSEAPSPFDALSGPHLYRHLYRDAVLDAIPADGDVLCLEPPPVPCPIGPCPKIFRAGLPGGLEPFPSFCNKFTSRSFVLTRTVRQKGPRLAGQGTRRACGVSRLFQAAFSVKTCPLNFGGQHDTTPALPPCAGHGMIQGISCLAKKADRSSDAPDIFRCLLKDTVADEHSNI